MMIDSSDIKGSGAYRDRMPNVVVIEDDEDVSRSLALLLRARGSSVCIYREGNAFLANYRTHSGHCILSDYKMPHIDGLEIIRQLRSYGDLTPAIMITGFYSTTLEERALAAGYAYVLEKPTPPYELIARIVSLC